MASAAHDGDQPAGADRRSSAGHRDDTTRWEFGQARLTSLEETLQVVCRGSLVSTEESELGLLSLRETGNEVRKPLLTGHLDHPAIDEVGRCGIDPHLVAESEL